MYLDHHVLPPGHICQGLNRHYDIEFRYPKQLFNPLHHTTCPFLVCNNPILSFFFFPPRFIFIGMTELEREGHFSICWLPTQMAAGQTSRKPGDQSFFLVSHASAEPQGLGASFSFPRPLPEVEQLGLGQRLAYYSMVLGISLSFIDLIQQNFLTSWFSLSSRI